MQPSTTFGRRGGGKSNPVVSRANGATPSVTVSKLGATRLTAIPWVTLGIMAALVAVFVLEFGVSAAGGHPGRISHSATLKLGGLSRELTLRQHQYWRLLTCSLLHLNLAHLIGNAVALALVGLLLEPIIGRGWFALIYVIGGVGGALGSLLLNPPQLVSVGASGAIMCVLSSSLVLSFHTASFERRKRMQMLGLRVMIPALLPLSGMHGHVDYSAHLGGAVTGMIMGFLLQIHWPEDEPRPPQGDLASLLASASGIVGAVALGTACLLPSSGAVAKTPGLIPLDETPETPTEWITRAAQLATQYPDDPRPHLFKAIALVRARDDAGAEVEYLNANRSPLLGAPELPAALRTAIRGGLVGVYLQEGRANEAKAEAAPFCAAPASVEPRIMSLINRAKLCDNALAGH